MPKAMQRHARGIRQSRRIYARYIHSEWDDAGISLTNSCHSIEKKKARLVEYCC
jgi:hypothetical protein